MSGVYRKPTFTGLGLNYLSFVPKIYKTNSIKTLLNRAFSLCSTYHLFNIEINKLRTYFQENSYPTFLFDRLLNKFLNKKYDLKIKPTTVDKDVRYFKMPFLGHCSYYIRKQLLNILKNSFPQINFRIVFTNEFIIGSLLKKRENRPMNLTSCCVYLFSCPSCNARYIGSSTRWLQHRIADHIGVSTRTSLPLSNPPFSAIRDHAESLDHNFTNQNFKILTSCPNRADLITLEALYIERMKPSLNRQTSVNLYTK